MWLAARKDDVVVLSLLLSAVVLELYADNELGQAWLFLPSLLRGIRCENKGTRSGGFDGVVLLLDRVM
jgi:hypothetical protein